MDKMTRILVMSDTHGLRQDDVTKIIQNEHCDYNIHCGDYGYSLDYMKQHFNYFVLGNNDQRQNDEQLAIKFEISGFKFYLLHGNQLYWHPYKNWIKNLFIEATKQDVDVLLFGHSHSYFVGTSKEHIIIANPGSVTMGRYGRQTYMIITIKNREINFEKHLGIVDKKDKKEN